MLFRIYYANIKNINNLFFNKRFLDNKINNQIQALTKYKKFNYIPAKAKKKLLEISKLSLISFIEIKKLLKISKSILKSFIGDSLSQLLLEIEAIYSITSNIKKIEIIDLTRSNNNAFINIDLFNKTISLFAKELIFQRTNNEYLSLDILETIAKGYFRNSLILMNIKRITIKNNLFTFNIKERF